MREKEKVLPDAPVIEASHRTDTIKLIQNKNLRTLTLAKKRKKYQDARRLHLGIQLVCRFEQPTAGPCLAQSTSLSHLYCTCYLPPSTVVHRPRNTPPKWHRGTSCTKAVPCPDVSSAFIMISGSPVPLDERDAASDRQLPSIPYCLGFPADGSNLLH